MKPGPTPKPRVITDCEWCGQPVKWAQRPSRQGRFCSRRCAGRAKTKGGLQFAQGRWFVRFRNGSKAHYARCLMEAHIGRDLLPSEHVHHVNGDTADDRLENLRILSAVEHHALHIAQGDTGRRPYKLTADQIRAIVASTDSAKSAAKSYGVSEALIYYHRSRALLKSQGRA